MTAREAEKVNRELAAGDTDQCLMMLPVQAHGPCTRAAAPKLLIPSCTGTDGATSSKPARARPAASVAPPRGAKQQPTARNASSAHKQRRPKQRMSAAARSDAIARESANIDARLAAIEKRKRELDAELAALPAKHRRRWPSDDSSPTDSPRERG